jgi:hypothetical protein
MEENIPSSRDRRYRRVMPIATYSLTALDCPDPLALAGF